MHLDVAELSGFYKTPLGRIVRSIVATELASIWPDATAERVVGLGHATPFLTPYLGQAERVIALMPAAEGVHSWPTEGPNLTALTFEHQLPLPDNSVDKLLVIHMLESAPDPFAVLREVWRVLMPAGRVLVMVPYRNGAWARADHTPMGLGRPFSRFQLRELLEAALLETLEVRRFLYVPPTNRRFVLGSTTGWEKVGRAVWPRFAGLLAIEAQKSMLRGIPARRPSGLRILVPDLAPRPRGVVGAFEALPWGVRPGGSGLSGAAGTPPARRKGSRTTKAR